MTGFEIQVHKLKNKRFCLVARRASDGFSCEFRGFSTRVEARQEGMKMLEKLGLGGRK